MLINSIVGATYMTDTECIYGLLMFIIHQPLASVYFGFHLGAVCVVKSDRTAFSVDCDINV